MDVDLLELSSIETEKDSQNPGRIGKILSGILFLFLLGAAYWFHSSVNFGREFSVSVLAGSALGFVMQRSRFCFFCNFRDYYREGDPRGTLGILTAIAVSTIGTFAVFDAWIPSPNAGYLPPNAFIGPVHVHLLLGGFSFGLGMILSGSCVSGHLYRIAEGSFGSIPTLVGVGFGFILGFLTWNSFYSLWIAEAPVIWLPQRFGYAGSLGFILLVLAAIAVWISRKGIPSDDAALKRSNEEASTFGNKFPNVLFEGRWPSWIGGILVGLISILYYLRVRPLGVTSELGRISRNIGNSFGILPDRLYGLDSIAGCATKQEAHSLTINAVFTVSLIAGSFVSSLAASQFHFSIPEKPGWKILFSWFGGILLGWGTCVAVGCTFGTFFSGISAGSLSGFVFAFGLIPGILLGNRLLNGSN
ncbi:YeeE/YedE family protein [Leptospira yasudae]|uniref:YeeE/YedE family protein n=1 Tax=Leptospira yasudae TaxID=2202201 RepID=A0A6N4QUY9_9LEPT|nr:YeeE/YedE family protein [Leptospira yasudae]TGL79103.1 YeeE/YedE family protein [Leptospira yasudae]TGL83149.1 YeeE/YedE family protein [Leptospira yasudae]TGL85620.1 YeeE/YedE family protein [Leptospira yasudae]